jgi:uncharacterized protein (DUF4415 family)
MARQPVKLLDDDEPFLDDEQLAKLRRGNEVLPPALFAMLTASETEAKASREQRDTATRPVMVPLTIQVEKSTADALRALGPGWQERAGEILRRDLARK